MVGTQRRKICSFFPFLFGMRRLTGEFRRDIEESQMTTEAPEQGLPK